MPHCVYVAGKARWEPTISEYREAKGTYQLVGAASKLLVAEPPSATSDLLTATSQFLTTGRCDLSAGLVGHVDSQSSCEKMPLVCAVYNSVLIDNVDLVAGTQSNVVVTPSSGLILLL